MSWAGVEDISIRLFASPKSLSDDASTNPRLFRSVRMAFISLRIQSFQGQQKQHFRYFPDGAWVRQIHRHRLKAAPSKPQHAPEMTARPRRWQTLPAEQVQ